MRSSAPCSMRPKTIKGSFSFRLSVWRNWSPAPVKNLGDEAARDDLRLILEMPAKIKSPSRDECIAAGWLRLRHKLSTADTVIAAQAELIHKDPELEACPGIKQRRLPYKPSKR